MQSVYSAVNGRSAILRALDGERYLACDALRSCRKCGAAGSCRSVIKRQRLQHPYSRYGLLQPRRLTDLATRLAARSRFIMFAVPLISGYFDHLHAQNGMSSSGMTNSIISGHDSAAPRPGAAELRRRCVMVAHCAQPAGILRQELHIICHRIRRVLALSSAPSSLRLRYAPRPPMRQIPWYDCCHDLAGFSPSMSRGCKNRPSLAFLSRYRAREAAVNRRNETAQNALPALCVLARSSKVAQGDRSSMTLFMVSLS